MVFPKAAPAKVLLSLFLASMTALASLCVPDVLTSLLSSGDVLEHPTVKDALQQVQQNLTAYFVSGNLDGLSFAISHSSTSHSIFSFNHGIQRLNESSGPSINGDTGFRVVSVSKSIAAASALVVINESKAQTSIPRLILDSPLVDVLPSFKLPEKNWKNGRSEITLSMLGSESSGLPREGYQTGFDDASGLARASVASIGDFWSSATPDSVVQSVSQQGLVFAPSQRASYSNARFSLLGYGIANYRNRLRNSSLSWSEVATEDMLKPLNMFHSFFGPIPNDLKNTISVPNTANWADLVIRAGYDPAVGMWSSANDIVSYLYHVWLQPKPQLITPTQRRTVLQPRLTLPDGVQELGFGWEISVTKQNSTYNIFGKSGDGGGYHSYLSILPNLGLGLVILTAEGSPPSANYSRLVPETIATSAHEFLIPAFRTAYSDLLAARFAGNYSLPGAIATPDSLSSNHALVEVEDNTIYLRNLVYGNVSALLRLDMLGWTANSHSIFYSTPSGAALAPSDVEEGANFRIFAEAALCDYMDFAGYTDENGWGLDRVQFLEHDNGMVELRYPPLNARLFRN